MSRKPFIDPRICTAKLGEIYNVIYELPQELGINEEFLLNTSRNSIEDPNLTKNLTELLRMSEKARDSLVTWHLKQSLVELNVTISLLTARIKFIEYHLGLCNGLDLHQACSLSLVNFCNILADLTVLNVSRDEKKTMHKVAAEVDVPVWLSHYRNQICHLPSESPCISILVPLIAKSLDYMRDSFWSRMLVRDNFDTIRFKKLLTYISKLTYITSINRQLRLKKEIELGPRRAKVVEQNLKKYHRASIGLKKLILQNPTKGVSILADYVTSFHFKDDTRNFALLIEQVIYAKCFEKLVFKILSLVEEKPYDKKRLSWLRQLITLISYRDQHRQRRLLKQMELSASVKIRKYTEIPPIICCRLAYRMAQLDSSVARKLVIRISSQLEPILGEEKSALLVELTRLSLLT